ncbi:MAG: HAD family phosphatase [Terracidiphilus sp.]
MHSEIKGIILDYGEVLCVRPNEEQVAQMADVFGISQAQFATLYEKNRNAYDRGDLTPEVYWSSFADELGIGLHSDRISHLRAWDVEMWSDLNPVMIEWLVCIHRGGIRTAVLSNMHADMVARLRGGVDWIKHVDVVVLSQEVRLAKPEAEIYAYCLDRLGTTPHETLFIDDREVNVNAGQALGIKAVRFESVSQLRSELEKLGFPIVPSESVADLARRFPIPSTGRD